MDVCGSQSMDSKFAHLLQPIRDVAGNWDVNVAEELEEYLVRIPSKLKLKLERVLHDARSCHI